jgi:hypothetical protein
MNPLASHWLRLSAWLFALSPVLAFGIALLEDASFSIALIFTLYMWAFVCVILALIALAGLLVRMANRGWRAFRR